MSGTILTTGSFENHTTSSKKRLLHIVLPVNLIFSCPIHHAKRQITLNILNEITNACNDPLALTIPTLLRQMTRHTSLIWPRLLFVSSLAYMPWGQTGELLLLNDDTNSLMPSVTVQ